MAWVERPAIANDISGYAEAREVAPMPISDGEYEFTRWDHEGSLKEDAVDILQPDMDRVDGIMELQKVADMAKAHGVLVIPYTDTNSTLHAVAGHMNMPMVEYLPTPGWFEEHREKRESIYTDTIF